MSKEEAAIGKRVFRLSQLRKELTLARSEFENGAAQLRTALDRMKVAQTTANVTWPTHKEHHELEAKINALQQEADKLIQELSNLGVDADLFKLNGT